MKSQSVAIEKNIYNIMLGSKKMFSYSSVRLEPTKCKYYETMKR